MRIVQLRNQVRAVLILDLRIESESASQWDHNWCAQVSQCRCTSTRSSASSKKRACERRGGTGSKLPSAGEAGRDHEGIRPKGLTQGHSAPGRLTGNCSIRPRADSSTVSRTNRLASRISTPINSCPSLRRKDGNGSRPTGTGHGRFRQPTT